jgi:hypothetical protein
MDSHPAEQAFTLALPKVKLATVDMLVSQPNGVHIVRLYPLDQPDCMELSLTGNVEAVIPKPVGDTKTLASLGPCYEAMSPSLYGLAPCGCCVGTRWRIIISVIYIREWQDYIPQIAEVFGRHVLMNFRRYCLRDLEALLRKVGR